MAEAHSDVLITGIGIVSCLGEGPDAHWQRLNMPLATPDTTTFAPCIAHPIVAIDFDKQIPKKGDQRQMEPWQRIGTYAAGLALDNANAKNPPDLVSGMDMIIAAAGGERDLTVDGAILTGIPQAENRDKFLNERLMSDLRPTLFLAQLSNLLAGNISIVHGVTGSSRTFLGEESAGFDAVRIALARIQAGQSDITLVGGAHNGERKDLFMLYETGGFNLKAPFRPVWERGPQGGFALGSLGAFLVLESREHARQRGAQPIAKLSTVVAERSDRTPGAVTAALDQMWDKIAAKTAVDENHAAFVSGATGAEPATGEERAFFGKHPTLPVRATGSHIGHGLEPQFSMNIALAALALRHGKLFAPADKSGVERPMTDALKQVIVTGVGHWRGEGMALVEAVG
ncbi:MAG: beta-ketoacyl-ACP synthase [Xanthobacteraceae bacterium]